MTSNPLVSVIVPTHNRAALLQRAIHSVLGQTYDNLECIVIDDASTDETPDVVSKFRNDRLIYLRHNENLGGSAARNAGIDRARGKLVAFLDDDDEWLPTKLEKQVALMAACPEDVGMVHCIFYKASEKGIRTEVNKARDFTGNVYVKLLQGQCPVITSLVLIKRECFALCGGFDESLMSFQDYDMWLRLAQRYRFECVEEPLVIIHQHQGPRVSIDIAPRKAGLQRILQKWETEMRSNLGDVGYQNVVHHFTTALYVNATRSSAQQGKLSMGLRYLVRVIRLNPTRPKLYCWLAYSLIRAAQSRIAVRGNNA